jgi:hypothetical protein
VSYVTRTLLYSGPLGDFQTRYDINSFALMPSIMSPVIGLSSQTVMATVPVPVQTTPPTQSPAGVKTPISSPFASGAPSIFEVTVSGTATVALSPVKVVNVKCVWASAAELKSAATTIPTNNTLNHLILIGIPYL